MQAVIDGVRSFATKTVFEGASDISVSSVPSRMERMEFLISITSVARCFVSSSSADEKTIENISHTVTRALSAHCPFSMSFSISPFIYGSLIMRICPEIISASF